MGDVDAATRGNCRPAAPPLRVGRVPGAARRTLSVLPGAPRLAAMVLTEVSPGYDAEGTSPFRSTEAVAGALTAGLTGT
ncbi:MAG TPA: hypothetical protein VHF26_02305 [Trebonia sp.]|nr:hypothetical protein [Trebonia sp.]